MDHEGEVLESYATKRRNRNAALKFFRKPMKRHGKDEVFVTDQLRSYGAAMKVTGNADKQETGRWTKKPWGEFTPALSKAGTRDATLSVYAKFAEICLRPRFSSQPLQPGTPSLFTEQFQAEPRRRSC